MFGLALIPLVLVLVIFASVAKNAPNRPAPKALGDYLKALADKDSWWFMFFYSVTFGGFLGLASALPGYFFDQYGFDPVKAGYYTAACVFAGSLMRPLGGALADRIGGIRSLLVMYTVAALAIAVVGVNLPSASAALALFVVAMLCLGAGNGAVFQLVPQRFHREIGVMTGLIGMAGGIGGFLPGRRPGCHQTGQRRLSAGPVAVRQPWRAGLDRPVQRQASLAHHLGQFGGHDGRHGCDKPYHGPRRFLPPRALSSVTRREVCMSLQLSIGEATAIGPRSENQDALRVVTPAPALASSKGNLLALADGVSQCADGGLAARATLQALALDYYATPETWAVAQSLDRLLLAHNRWLQANGGGQPLLTTLTALVLRGRRYTLAHIGDCRIYRYADSLELLTEDHVWEQPNMQHVLKRALGLDQSIWWWTTWKASCNRG